MLPASSHAILSKSKRKDIQTEVFAKGNLGRHQSCFTDKKENKIFLISKEFQKGTVAKSYMTIGLLIYYYIFAHFLIY